MPWYNDLRPLSDEKKKEYALIFPAMTDAEKLRCIKNILLLIPELDKAVPVRKTESNLLIASWNLKEFGHTKQRLPESYFYIAEILNRFDLIAIQELKSGLKDLEIVMRLLGKDWGYLINDITEGRDGNSERSGYLYNQKRVKPSGLAGEISLWDDLTQTSTIKQLKRSPYVTGFETGWKKFELINLHLHPGEDVDDIPYRLEEVTLLMKAITHKLVNNRLWSDNLILLGDMNLYHPTPTKLKDKPAVDVINATGFREIESLIGVDTNATGSQAYDRMFFHVNEYFRFVKNAAGKESGGVFRFFEHIYKEAGFATYAADLQRVYGGDDDMTLPANQQKYFRNTWRKNQISDHYPIWAEIIIDNTVEFLKEKEASFV
jgi:endonuclease/exonuclease/phosphatase family metal-dependent hydrolase